MEEWKEYKLKDVTTILGDGLHGTPKYDENGTVFFINGNNLVNGKIEIKDSTKRVSENEAIKYKKNLNSRTILVSINGTIGNAAKYRGEACILGKSACYFNVSENFDLNFIYYVVASQQFKNAITQLATGTTIKNVSLETMRNYSFFAPNIEEQKRISSFLSFLDDKIELNRRINANLEAQAQALFRSWFVDFEPFRDGPFVDSQLGKIPQGWKVGTINEIIQILSGYAFKSDTFTEAGPYRLITIKNVQDGSLNIDGAAYLSDIPDKMPQHCHLAIGDILLSLTGNVGRVCIVDRDGLLLNQRVAKLQPKDKRNTFFTYALFRQDSFKQYLIQIAKGTAQLNLSPVETSDTKIVLPNQDVLLQFGEIGQPLFDNIVSTCKEIITLSALRDTLLPKLMAGEINLD